MLGGWFYERTGGSEAKKDGFADDKSPTQDQKRSRSLSVGPQFSEPLVSSGLVKSSSSSLISPHDHVISQMDEKLREMRLAETSSAFLQTQAAAIPAETTATPQQKSSHAENKSRKNTENMYDPFDGQSIGLMVPGEFEEAEDDLWTHLAHIRDLQSEIAKMHSHMEGLGENERLHRPDQTVDDDTAYAEEGKAAEFAKLSDRFNGRKDAIDAIMLKLETLSRAINDFHSSRAPFFRFTSISNQHMGAVKSDMEAKTPGDVNSQQPLTRFLSESHDNLILKGSPDSALPSLFDSDNSNP